MASLGRRLENTPMYINILRGGWEVISPVFNWEIHNFSKLKKDTHYKLRFRMEKFGWSSTVQKTKNSLNATLFMTPYNSNQTVKCAVLYERKGEKQEFPVEEIQNGAYQCRIPLKSLLVSSNKLLQQDIVLIVFIFKRSKLRHHFLRPCIEGKNARKLEKAFDEMQKDFNKMSISDTADFSLQAEDTSIPCHKAILSARSKYFYQYFRKDSNKDIQAFNIPSTTKEALHMAVHYMYFGGVIILNIPVAIQLLKLSAMLKMTNLVDMITLLLMNFVREETVHEIRDISLQYGLDLLIEVTDKFLLLSKSSKDYNISNAKLDEQWTG